MHCVSKNTTFEDSFADRSNRKLQKEIFGQAKPERKNNNVTLAIYININANFQKGTKK
ncbi:hypothetical protein [Wolbachia endosymbiont of Dirofilaria (Dirofilaria) immitis]|uniref:hypothetical protein n=1 Tax=Wolbachia endosymbiont of Dirofilaria (Dirofilaria) immitis TaxID=1812115 RepID=UPI00158E7512|nr:hypothetical protein [Wolbachia endosymbiont of Dirofilaria (Dirofilaria) immitis]QKX02512.1 hypothetical protein GOY12_03075 [Wolbachia endosymbiont of Dirofilaria (Dirofilaria) immitis]